MFVVPAGANEAAVHFGSRIGAKAVSEQGAVTFAPLPRGRYEVRERGRLAVTLVEVEGPGTKTSLP